MHQRGVVSSGQTFVNAGDEDEMKITGFRKEHMKEVLSWILTVATFGFLQLLFYWRPHWRLKLTCAVTHLDQAEYVLLEDQYGQKFVEGVDYLPSDDNFLVSHKQSQKPEVVLLVQNSDQQVEHVDEDLDLALLHNKKSRKYFTNKLVKYFWNSQLQHFEKLCGLEEGVFCSFFHESKGLTEVQQLERRRIYGSNNISVHVTPVIKLLYTQVLNPFYIFQLFSCILWFSDTYFYYATCIVLVSCISIAVQIYQTRSMQRAVKSTIAPVELVNVYRSDTGEFETVHSDALVPGDIIEVPRRGCMMQCDAVLVNGNCIVNESMLTGESVPVTKTPISNHSLLSKDLNQAESAETSLVDIKFQMKEHSRHVLFCGTHVIQTRYYGNQPVKAVVIRTGFSTAKGELVRSILFPKPVDFKFSEDGIRFVGALSVMAVIGMLYTLVLMVMRDENAWLIVRRTLDLITIIVPPALPAAMTVGIVFAQKRLSRRNIFCISPRSINLCGALNVFCFDKTGTLTEDGLDMWGVVTVRENKFSNEKTTVQDLHIHDPVVVCMATCHSLTIVEGQITGDPLDVKMFEATDWMFEEPGEDSTKFDVIAPSVVHPKKPDIVNVSAAYDCSETLPYEIGIIRQFTFSSKLQRMSVISRELSANHFDLYAKGSPEMIASLCKPDTVPSNFHDVLMLYTEQGYRVIGLAHRKLPNMSYVKVQRALRDQMESELTFLGLLILENRLKIETMPVIRSLKEANIRTLMITGDNMLTALSVARDCGMIECNDRVVNITVLSPGEYERPRIEYMAMNSKDKIDSNALAVVDIDTNDRIHFAITGKSWALLRRYFPEILPKLVVRGTVFARFSPEQKQQLIESLQSVGYYVGMCGDGANDCGALKTAHAGISLSEAEASVASPFTSKEPNICCVPILIMEGRTALVTSFGIFKFMAGYSMTQFLSVCLVYWIGANLTDGTFLYIDLPLLTTLGITFCYTRAYPILHPKPPKISLVAVTPILSILLTLAVNMVAQVVVFIWIRRQPWFEEYSPTHEADYRCYEVTAVFSISAFQYITMAVVFSKGSPYRQHMFTNYLFLLNLFLCTAVTMVIVVYPPEFVADLLNLRLAPSTEFRGLIVGLASINFLLSLLVETIVIDGLVDGRLMQRWHDTVASKRLDYVRIEDEIKRLGNWPPISHVGLSLIDAMRLEHSSPGYYDDHQISNGKIPRQDSFSPEHGKNLSDNSPSSVTTTVWPPSSTSCCTGLDSLTVEIHDRSSASGEKMSHDAAVSVL